jgi:ribosomal protein S1
VSKDPWNCEIPSTYRPGLVVAATVVEIGSFGIYVEPEPGLRGEIRDDTVGRSFSIGQTVEVRVLVVDTAKHKIMFSIHPRMR